MSCLDCVHAKLTPHVDWTPSYRGQTYDKYHVRQVMEETGLAQPITCTLNPVWQEFNTNHFCGQWSTETDGLKLREANTRLSSQYVMRNELYEQIKKLKAELKKVREISAGRLTRLKANS